MADSISQPLPDRRSARLARFWIALDNATFMPRHPVIMHEEWRAAAFRADSSWDVRGPFVPEAENAELRAELGRRDDALVQVARVIRADEASIGEET